MLSSLIEIIGNDEALTCFLQIRLYLQKKCTKILRICQDLFAIMNKLLFEHNKHTGRFLTKASHVLQYNF